MDVLTIVAVIAILIFFNGIFVAAEIGTIGARRTRVAQVAGEGHPMAHVLLLVLEDPHLLDNYIAACQLGITLWSDSMISEAMPLFFGPSVTLLLPEPAMSVSTGS